LPCRFFSILFLRAAKLHSAFGGGSMTLLPLVPGRPASGTKAALDFSKYQTLSEEQKAKLQEVLEKRKVSAVTHVCSQSVIGIWGQHRGTLCRYAVPRRLFGKLLGADAAPGITLLYGWCWGLWIGPALTCLVRACRTWGFGSGLDAGLLFSCLMRSPRCSPPVPRVWFSRLIRLLGGAQVGSGQPIWLRHP
jgi:hypothetical protein